MSSSLNKVQLIGRLGKDPEIRSFQNGGKAATRHKPDQFATIGASTPESTQNRRPYRIKSQPRGMHTKKKARITGRNNNQSAPDDPGALAACRALAGPGIAAGAGALR